MTKVGDVQKNVLSFDFIQMFQSLDDSFLLGN